MAAVEANDTPALPAMLAGPFQLDGPQMLEMALAAMTPEVEETENRVRPFAPRAVTVLTKACLMRAPKLHLVHAK